MTWIQKSKFWEWSKGRGLGHMLYLRADALQDLATWALHFDDVLRRAMIEQCV